ncbi:uncharacterized protein BDR25DRAFT_362952 [Lindgomyces ingoldianus]|uniref:Uncharacterized protein n=1 Tax=Lindgomyces ingoldianus TaxID=673940 RepID=A0ACB6Q8P3_9PLEO|nr:uncharacterized protein BDR25DRAFT_362952 [Lindgomyces ingoldianus]KAF2463409.1 hypothetical protein BDR25DRAFT_362952 [Lindgomyces ingoldianus]
MVEEASMKALVNHGPGRVLPDAFGALRMLVNLKRHQKGIALLEWRTFMLCTVLIGLILQWDNCIWILLSCVRRSSNFININGILRAVLWKQKDVLVCILAFLSPLLPLRPFLHVLFLISYLPILTSSHRIQISLAISIRTTIDAVTIRDEHSPVDKDNIFRIKEKDEWRHIFSGVTVFFLLQFSAFLSHIYATTGMTCKSETARMSTDYEICGFTLKSWINHVYQLKSDGPPEIGVSHMNVNLRTVCRSSHEKMTLYNHMFPLRTSWVYNALLPLFIGTHAAFRKFKPLKSLQGRFVHDRCNTPLAHGRNIGCAMREKSSAVIRREENQPLQVEVSLKIGNCHAHVKTAAVMYTEGLKPANFNTMYSRGLPIRGLDRARFVSRRDLLVLVSNQNHQEAYDIGPRHSQWFVFKLYEVRVNYVKHLHHEKHSVRIALREKGVSVSEQDVEAAGRFMMRRHCMEPFDMERRIERSRLPEKLADPCFDSSLPCLAPGALRTYVLLIYGHYLLGGLSLHIHYAILSPFCSPPTHFVTPTHLCEPYSHNNAITVNLLRAKKFFSRYYTTSIPRLATSTRHITGNMLLTAILASWFAASSLCLALPVQETVRSDPGPLGTHIRGCGTVSSESKGSGMAAGLISGDVCHNTPIPYGFPMKYYRVGGGFSTNNISLEPRIVQATGQTSVSPSALRTATLQPNRTSVTTTKPDYKYTGIPPFGLLDDTCFRNPLNLESIPLWSCNTISECFSVQIENVRTFHDIYGSMLEAWEHSTDALGDLHMVSNSIRHLGQFKIRLFSHSASLSGCSPSWSSPSAPSLTPWTCHTGPNLPHCRITLKILAANFSIASRNYIMTLPVHCRYPYDSLLPHLPLHVVLIVTEFNPLTSFHPSTPPIPLVVATPFKAANLGDHLELKAPRRLFQGCHLYTKSRLFRLSTPKSGLVRHVKLWNGCMFNKMASFILMKRIQITYSRITVLLPISSKELISFQDLNGIFRGAETGRSTISLDSQLLSSHTRLYDLGTCITPNYPPLACDALFLSSFV